MTAKITQKKDKILTTAANLLVKQGGINFSMRTLADELGIRLSNLQYYFPTLDTLYSAIVTNILLLVEDKIDQAMTYSDETLKILIDIVCSELDNVYNCQLMWEIWALSERTPEARNAIDLFYQHYIEKISHIIKLQNPTLNSNTIQRRALIIVSLLEGIWVVMGKNQKDVELDTIKIDLMTTINLIINNP